MISWTDSSGRLDLELSLEEAQSGSHSGDCEGSVRELMELPHIKAQLDAMPLEDIQSNLREYGAWDEEELADEDMCKVRTLWLACGDILANPTPVHFRKLEGTVLAIFPDQPGAEPDLCGSYQHVGQHGDASRSLIEELEAAAPEEYAELREELEGPVGYYLEVRP